MPHELSWEGVTNFASLNSSDGETRQREFIFRYYKFLINGAFTGRWTVAGSSDGAGAGGMDAVDRWAGYTSAADLVHDSDGNNHSWIVLSSPTNLGYGAASTQLHMLLAYGDLYYRWTKVVSGQPFTGGSGTTRPTTVGTTMGYTEVDEAPYWGDGASFALGAMATTGEHWFTTIRNSDGESFGSTGILRVADLDSSDEYPYVIGPRNWSVGTPSSSTKSFRDEYYGLDANDVLRQWYLTCPRYQTSSLDHSGDSIRGGAGIWAGHLYNPTAPTVKGRLVDVHFAYDGIPGARNTPPGGPYEYVSLGTSAWMPTSVEVLL